MKFKKTIALLLSAVTATAGLAVAGCGDTPKNDGKTLNIMMQLSGWGTAYMEEMAAQFETTFAEEGYKVNLLDARSSFNGSAALSEMRLEYDKVGYDLVMTGGVTIKQGLDPEFGKCIAEIDEVFNNGAINFDKSVEATPIKDLMEDYVKDAMSYNGHYYTFSSTESVRGLVYNKKVLERYGITEAPRTTDELFEQFDIIMDGTETVDGIKPVTWGGGNAYGYALGTLYAGLAQLMGVEYYDEFYKLNYILNDDGTVKSDWYKLYEDKGTEFKEVLEVLIKKFDVLYSYSGAKEQIHTNAHAQVVTGKTAFMQDGEYFYNEVMYDFPTYLNDIRMAPTPIISYLGVQEKLDGTGENAVLCDEILSFMVKCYDEGKTNAQIKELTNTEFASKNVNVTDAQVERIVEARGVTHADYSNGTFVMENSPVKDIAFLFLRMLASKDTAQNFAKYGKLHRLYPVEESAFEREFIKDCARIANRTTYNSTSVLVVDSVRANTNMFLIPPYNALLPVTINNEIGVDREIGNYEALANSTYSKILEYVAKEKESLISAGGYKLG